MKKILGVLAVGCLAGSAMAGPQVRFYNTDGSDNEDGFTADLGANGYSNPTGDYVTFCVETLEHFGYGTTYEYLISDQVRDNGGNGNLALNTQAGRRVAVQGVRDRRRGRDQGSGRGVQRVHGPADP